MNQFYHNKTAAQNLFIIQNTKRGDCPNPINNNEKIYLTDKILENWEKEEKGPSRKMDEENTIIKTWTPMAEIDLEVILKVIAIIKYSLWNIGY